MKKGIKRRTGHLTAELLTAKKEALGWCILNRPQVVHFNRPVRWYVHTNHPMTAFGDHLGALKVLAQELGIPFECYDHCTPDQLA